MDRLQRSSPNSLRTARSRRFRWSRHFSMLTPRRAAPSNIFAATRLWRAHPAPTMLTCTIRFDFHRRRADRAPSGFRHVARGRQVLRIYGKRDVQSLAVVVNRLNDVVHATCCAAIWSNISCGSAGTGGKPQTSPAPDRA